MILANPLVVPFGATLSARLASFMEIVLHIGAHRTGSTTFQAYMRANHDVLEANKIGFWGPGITRRGLFSGLEPVRAGPGQTASGYRRAAGRISLRLDQAIERGVRALIISEENIAGSVRDCVRGAEIYPALGERAVRYGRAFGGRISRIVLCIRSLDRFWASALAMGVERGMPVPSLRHRKLIATSSRSWRNVVTDLSRAMPEAEICVLPFEGHFANPQDVLFAASGKSLPTAEGYDWLNKAPDLGVLRKALADRGQDTAQLPHGDGVWQPFDDEQVSRFRETYADDLFWLAAGADGLATLTGDIPVQGRENARAPGEARGHEHDEEGRLDKAG